MHISAIALSRGLHSDLSSHIDVQQTSWAPDSTPLQVACYALKSSFVKKFMEEDKPSELACLRAQEKFLNVNKRCASWVIPYETSLDELLVGGVKDAIYRFWYTSNGGPEPCVSNFMQLYVAGRSGPGSGLCARSNDLYTKMYDSPLSYTGDLLYVWDKCVSKCPVSLEAELHRRQLHGSYLVDCNKLSFVNKTVTIARPICTEPTINMWFQKGMGTILATQLDRHWGINMSNQPHINAELARVGSIDGSLATIDLESASDSLSENIMSKILPRSMFEWLKLLRTPNSQLPNQEVVALNMISTQGNGFNSALQTIVFTAVIQSAYNSLGISLHGRGPSQQRNFGCFGDDLIVVKEAFVRVSRLLHLLGFVVNADKSFVEGRFRESCGSDYFEGANVRGVYVKTMRTLHDRFVAINTLNRWSTKTGVFLPLTMRLLLNGIKRPDRYLIPPDEDDAAGIHCPAVIACLTTTRHTRLYGQMTYLAECPRASAFYLIGQTIWTFKEQVLRNVNPNGLYITFLAGDLRALPPVDGDEGTRSWGYSITLRQNVIKYTTKDRKSVV